MRSTSHRLIQAALRAAFRQLYTNFAWTYDAVAAMVSLGEWQEWGRTALGFIEPPGGRADCKLLEIGHGPGHLHLTLRQMGYCVAGVDLSPQMSAIARHRLRQAGLSNSLARASVFHLPFPDAAFTSVISTFPAEFIFAPQMLAEAWRVLAQDGRMVVAPTTLPRAGQLLSQVVSAWQSISQPSEPQAQAIQQRFARAGFSFQRHDVPTRRFQVVVWVLTRSDPAAFNLGSVGSR
jgi:ubiquinone/menaquinone biosynthesis C-methylase UbiE